MNNSTSCPINSVQAAPITHVDATFGCGCDSPIGLGYSYPIQWLAKKNLRQFSDTLATMVFEDCICDDVPLWI